MLKNDAEWGKPLDDNMVHAHGMLDNCGYRNMLLHDSWELTNVMHKFFSVCLFLFITLYMFQAHSAHHQERQIVPIQPLVTVILKIGE